VARGKPLWAVTSPEKRRSLLHMPRCALKAPADGHSCGVVF